MPLKNITVKNKYLIYLYKFLHDIKKQQNKNI